ncbi:class I SAM-dependent DNA methyltransferase [Ferruginibacter sp.]|nr:class I SAM-dependent methyltransferase [Ferruginibacter sp.]
MNTQQAYNTWSQQYDTNNNKTRDLEAQSLQATLADINFDSCLEIGCGTGKNTAWLISKAKEITAIDLSEEMLAKAKEKINTAAVEFIKADITGTWNFATKQYELITFSLVLEHIQNLDHIFSEAAKALIKGGHVYIGELHPFKQYSGTKARFETAEGLQIVDCYNHNISEFTQAAKKHGFIIADINEHFDDNDKTTIPRIITLLLQKD